MHPLNRQASNLSKKRVAWLLKTFHRFRGIVLDKINIWVGLGPMKGLIAAHVIAL